VARGVIDHEQAAAFTSTTGHSDFTWTVYARADTLGPIAGGHALACARAVVVLCHGGFCNRHVWASLAPIICRKSPHAVVLVPDLYGSPDAPYCADVTPAQLQPTALTTVLRSWLAMLGLDSAPQVLVGHSYGATCLLSAADSDFGPRVWRVAVTPFFARGLQRVILRMMAPVLGVGLRWRWYRRLFTRWNLQVNAYYRTFTPELRKTVERLTVQQPARLVAAYFRALSRAVPAVASELRRCSLVLVETDPLLPQEAAIDLLRKTGLNERQVYLLGAGEHYPQVENLEFPEKSARNVDEIAAIVDIAINDGLAVDTSSAAAAEATNTIAQPTDDERTAE
jgi:pimeloyl-ACP methyl ester carboxylesterase